jgi:hypothetical protein
MLGSPTFLVLLEVLLQRVNDEKKKKVEGQESSSDGIKELTQLD